MKKHISDAHYAYSVTGVRILQKNLLDDADVRRLIAMPSKEDVLSFLKSKGWSVPSDDASQHINAVLDQRMQMIYDYINEHAPDIALLDPFVIRNDFHNLKAGIKSALIGHSASEHFISPTRSDRKNMSAALSENAFKDLPEPFSTVAEQAYDALGKSHDGQLSDILIDRCALDEMIRLSKAFGDPFVIEVVEAIVARTLIKIAYRAARIGKDKIFLDRAIATCSTLDRATLIEEAAKGVPALMEYLRTTPYKTESEYLLSSPFEFEKYGEDQIIESLYPIRYQGLGAAPIVAYYLAAEAEIKNIRVILSAKDVSLSEADVQSRLRRLYV